MGQSEGHELAFGGRNPEDPLSKSWVNVDRWGLAPPPEEHSQVVPVAAPVRPKPRPLKGYAEHEKLSDKKRLQLIKKLDARAPGPFQCKPECGKCCMQPVDMLTGEWIKLERLPIVRTILLEQTANGSQVSVVPRTLSSVKVGNDEGICPFLDMKTKACRIYEHRPYSCRAYGQHWFARCAAGVEMPELDISDADMQEWGKLGGFPYGVMALDRWPGTREVVEAWRKLDPENRRDMMPSFEQAIEDGDKLLATVPPESVAHTQLMAEMVKLRMEADAIKKAKEAAEGKPPTSNPEAPTPAPEATS